jgi:hypothetical protein
MIYHTLQNETKARGARKIAVVKLGLEPWEGMGMSLEAEEVEGTDRNRPVAPYVCEHDEQWRAWLTARDCDSWNDWLQSNRIELNALPPADRITWIAGKIEKHPPRKVIPPRAILHDQRVSAAREEISNELEARARIAERTEEILTKVDWSPTERIPGVVRRYLDRKRHRGASWIRPMTAAGKKQGKRTLAKLDAQETAP